MNTNYSSLLQLFTTKQELVQFLGQLDVLSQLVYSVNVDLTAKINELIPLHKKDALLQCLSANGISPNNKQAFGQFVKDFSVKARALPVLSLYVSFDPTEEQMKHFAEWIQQNLDKKILLELVVRQSVIGGAVLTYNGLYKDYSLKKKFKELNLTKNFVSQGDTPSVATQPQTEPQKATVTASMNPTAQAPLPPVAPAKPDVAIPAPTFTPSSSINMQPETTEQLSMSSPFVQ